MGMNFQRIQQAISEMKNNIGENNVDLTLRLGLPNVSVDQNVTNIRRSLNSVFLTPNLYSPASHDQTHQVPGGGDHHGGNRQIPWWMRAQSQVQSHEVMNSRLGGAGLGGAPSSNYTNIINNIVSYNNFANANFSSPQMNVDYIILNPSDRARRSERHAGGSRRRSTTRRQRRSVAVDPNKRCTNYNCATGTTPMWRRGPLGPKTLCNACGIKYRKQEEKKKQAEAAHADDADDKSDMSSCTTLNDYN